MNYVLIPEECQFVYIAVDQKRRADENKGRGWSKAPPCKVISVNVESPKG
jgi:hypothetical protein